MLEVGQARIPAQRSFNFWPAGWKAFGDEISRRLWWLDTDGLCAEARRRTGLQDFGEPAIEPAITVLANSLELEADLHPLGRVLMRAHLRELLETRLRLTQAWKGHSDRLESSIIQRPIFITGMPRSGSTFLHELLAEDPENRAPRVWEVMFPLPIKSKSPKQVDPRVRKAEASLWWFRRLAPAADSVYPMRALTPHECVAIHSYTLLSEEFVSTCHIPTYEAFLHAADLGPVYCWQKRFLQHLQLGYPKRRWVLKSPDHVYGLDKLLRVFPDALIVQTHRNPVDAVKSAIQLTRVLEGLFAWPDDRDQLGSREARKVGEILDRIIRFRDAHPDVAERFIDVKYSELVSDPLAIVRRIYDRLEVRLTEATAERMQSLASSRSRYQGRGAGPVQADLGLNCAAEIHRFKDYCCRFGIPCKKEALR